MKKNLRGLLLNFGGKRGSVGTSISTEVFVPTGEIPPHFLSQGTQTTAKRYLW